MCACISLSFSIKLPACDYSYHITVRVCVCVSKTLLCMHACVGLNLLERMQSRRGQRRRPGCDSADKDTPPTFHSAIFHSGDVFIQKKKKKNHRGCMCARQSTKKLPVERCVGTGALACLEDKRCKLGADPVSVEVSEFKPRRKWVFFWWQIADPWRHFCDFASHRSHMTARHPCRSSTAYSLHVTVTLLLIQLYSASRGCDIKFKSSFVLCCEFNCFWKLSGSPERTFGFSSQLQFKD